MLGNPAPQTDDEIKAEAKAKAAAEKAKVEAEKKAIKAKARAERRAKVSEYWQAIWSQRKTVIVLLGCCFLVGYFSRYFCCSDYAERHGGNKHDFIIATLVIVNFLVVTINTLLFLNDILKASEYVDRSFLGDIAQKKYNRIKARFLFCYFLTLIISIGVPACYFMQIFNVVKFEWEELFHWSEKAALAMFFLFWLADYLIKQMFHHGRDSNITKLGVFISLHTNLTNVSTQQQAIIDEKKEKIEKDIKEIKEEIYFLKYAIPLIDVTGLVGIALIYGLTQYVFKFDSISDPYILKGEKIFTEGLAIGAIAFHIFFTQLNFVILKVLSKVKDN